MSRWLKMVGVVLAVLLTLAMWFSGIERYQAAVIRGAVQVVGLSAIVYVIGRVTRRR